ncbi:MAG: flagellar assembly protein FliH [Azonexus sp.]|nr:flagellar assembly protein FliH [Azonexus sp.]
MSVIIPKEELANVQRWEAGSFDKKPTVAASPPLHQTAPKTIDSSEATNAFKLPTAEDIERIYEEARTSGYQAGLTEGRVAGELSTQESAELNAQRFNALISNLKSSLAELDQTVADQLLALAIEIASQVTRGVVAVKSDLLLPIIREAITGLPLHHAQIVLRMNPSDAEYVRPHLGEELTQSGTRIFEDSEITPGGCLLQAGASEIDATIEVRWKRVLEAIGVEPQEWLTP